MIRDFALFLISCNHKTMGIQIDDNKQESCSVHLMISLKVPYLAGTPLLLREGNVLCKKTGSYFVGIYCVENLCMKCVTRP